MGLRAVETRQASSDPPRPDRRRIAHRALRGRQLCAGRAKPHVALPSFPFPGGAQIRRTPRRSCRANLVRGTGGRRRIAHVRPIEIDGTGPRDNVQSLDCTPICLCESEENEKEEEVSTTATPRARQLALAVLPNAAGTGPSPHTSRTRVTGSQLRLRGQG